MSNQDSVRESRFFRHELQGLLHFVDFIQTPEADRAPGWPTPTEAAEWLLDGITELEKAIRRGRSKSIRPADEREVKEWIVKLLTVAKGIKRDVAEGQDFRPRLAKFRALAADGIDLLDSQNDARAGDGYKPQPKKRGKPKNPFTNQRAAFGAKARDKGHEWSAICEQYKSEHPSDMGVTPRDIAAACRSAERTEQRNAERAAKSKRTRA